MRICYNNTVWKESIPYCHFVKQFNFPSSTQDTSCVSSKWRLPSARDVHNFLFRKCLWEPQPRSPDSVQAQQFAHGAVILSFFFFPSSLSPSLPYFLPPSEMKKTVVLDNYFFPELFLSWIHKQAKEERRESTDLWHTKILPPPLTPHEARSPRRLISCDRSTFHCGSLTLVFYRVSIWKLSHDHILGESWLCIFNINLEKLLLNVWNYNSNPCP